VTTLTAPPPDNAYGRLAASADYLIQVQVNSSGYDSTTVGYQYVLGLIPVCRVHVDSMNAVLQTALHQELAERGVRAVEVSSLTPSLHRLVVTIKRARTSGFDLILFREPFAEVELNGQLFSPSGETMRADRGYATARNFSAFAFEAELQRVLMQAAKSAASELADRLGFPKNAVR
jgi:hypothetical protein